MKPRGSPAVLGRRVLAWPIQLTLFVAHQADSCPYLKRTVSGMLILHLNPLSCNGHSGLVTPLVLGLIQQRPCCTYVPEEREERAPVKASFSRHSCSARPHKVVMPGNVQAERSAGNRV